MDDYRDANMEPIKKGDRVQIYTGPGYELEYATVDFISDPDGDVNDYGRQIAIPPAVHVRYADGSDEAFPMTWTASGPWDSETAPYMCEDVVVIEERYEQDYDEYYEDR